MSQWLPDDWISGWQSLKDLNATSFETHARLVKALLSLGVPFAVGASASALVMPHLSPSVDPNYISGLMGSIVALGTVLSGFIITLMLFTGRIDQSAHLTLEQVDAYAYRIRYLLSSQAMTLFSSLIATLLAVSLLVMYAIKSSPASLTVIGTVLGGFVAVAVFRSALMPLQIYELHDAALKDLSDAKREEAIARFRSEDE
jgi:hypothetical protein